METNTTTTTTLNERVSIWVHNADPDCECGQPLRRGYRIVGSTVVCNVCAEEVAR